MILHKRTAKTQCFISAKVLQLCLEDHVFAQGEMEAEQGKGYELFLTSFSTYLFFHPTCFQPVL